MHIIDAYNAGLTDVVDLAIAFRTTIRHVRNTLPNPPQRLCSHTLAEMELAEGGWYAVAKRYNTTMLDIKKARQTPVLNTSDIITMWNATDISLTQLAKRFHITESRTLSILGYPSLIKELVASDMPPADVARLAGCAITTVYHYRSAMKMTIPQRRLSPERWADLLADKTLTITELANKYGISRAAIYKRRAM